MAAGCKKLTRKTWSNTEKKAVLDLLAFYKGMKRKTLDFLQSNYGNAFKTVTVSTLKRWQDAQQRAVEAGNPTLLNKKRGKKVCDDFGREVCAKVVEESASSHGEGGIVRLYANIAQTAEAMRQGDRWKSDERVQRLKFSPKWCHTVVRRHNEQHLAKRIPLEGAGGAASLGGQCMEVEGVAQASLLQVAVAVAGDKKRRAEPKAAQVDSNSVLVAVGRERVMSDGAAALGMLLRGGGRYTKSGVAADNNKASKILLKTKRLEEEVAVLRQQLDMERKRSAMLEQQLQLLAVPPATAGDACLEHQLLAMRAHGGATGASGGALLQPGSVANVAGQSWCTETAHTDELSVSTCALTRASASGNAPRAPKTLYCRSRD